MGRATCQSKRCRPCHGNLPLTTPASLSRPLPLAAFTLQPPARMLDPPLAPPDPDGRRPSALSLQHDDDRSGSVDRLQQRQPSFSSSPPPPSHSASLAHDGHPRRRRSSAAALSLRSFATVTRSPLPSPPLSPLMTSAGYPLFPSPPPPLSLAPSPSSPSPRQQPSPYSGSGSPQDPYIVCFAPRDPADPRNWPTPYRWFLMSCAALEMTGGTLGISIFTSGFGQMR